ncbi:MAG: hypothetical protein D6732_14805, partial [Methanobacteriota archaeon]
MRKVKELKEKLVEWLVPPLLDRKEKPVEFFRVRTLIELHIYLIAFMALMVFTTNVITPENEDVPLLWALGGLVFSMFLLKVTQSLEATGNFIAAGWFLVLVPAILKTGGLYSDNMLWLALAPAIAVLFAERRWGFVWAGVLTVFSIILLVLHQQKDEVFKEQLMRFTPEYYFLSFSLFFAVLLGIVYIFEKGQSLIIKALEEQKDLLAKHQMHIKKQMDELRAAQRKIEETNKQLEQFA